MTLIACCKPALAPAPASNSAASNPAAPSKGFAKIQALSPYPPDFTAWLAASPDQVPQFEALKAYLMREGVADILPIWQLIQTETPEAAAKCGIVGYAIPSQDKWPSIVPTLRLVRAEIVPLLGPVKVLSSFRTNEANKCSQGAPESPHKRYSALDLAMVTPISQKEMFAKLCQHWYKLSPNWGYGLGAYYIRGYPAYNQEGRFHVDTLGRRTWGNSYGAYTSHCRELGYISVKSPAQIKREEEAKLKAEADALAKASAGAKAKSEADTLAKSKAKEEVPLKALSAKANAQTMLLKATEPSVPMSEPQTSGEHASATKPQE